MSITLAEVMNNEVVALRMSRGKLLGALAKVQSVVERRNTIPILGNIKLAMTGSTVTFSATDMDLEVCEKADCTVEYPGSLTLPALMLYDIVRKLPEAEVNITSQESGGRAMITSGSAKFTLPTLPAQDFPSISDGDFVNSFTLTVAQTARLFAKTAFAMSTEETRYYLNGIYLHVYGDEGAQVLRAVSTDGHRLAKVEVAMPVGAGGMPGVIIPRKAVVELRKLLEQSSGDVNISLAANKIKFSMGNTVLVTKIIDGSYPDYERVIPSANDKIMEVSPKALSAAVDRVSTIAADKVRAVKFMMDKGALNLISSSPEMGTATETLDVTYGAEAMEIGFNARYVMEVLAQIDGETAQMVLADGAAPALVRDVADVSCSYVLMPMKI